MPEAVTTLAGFEEPVQQAQAVFRALLDAMAQPARVVDFQQGMSFGRHRAPRSVLLVFWIVDPDVDCTPQDEFGDNVFPISYRVRLHVDTGDTVFTLINGVDSDLILQFAIGTPEYPDRSTTVLVQVDALSEALAAAYRPRHRIRTPTDG